MHGERSDQVVARRPRALPEEGSRRCCALDCISGPFEDREHVVGHGFDRRSAVHLDGLPNDSAVLRCDLSNYIVAKFPKLSREAEHVGAEQRSDAAVGIARRLVLMGLRRGELALEPLHSQLEEALRAHDVLEAELAQIAELELDALEILDDPGRCVRDENLAAVRRTGIITLNGTMEGLQQTSAALAAQIRAARWTPRPK